MDQLHDELEKYRNNPKFQKLVQHIDALSDRSLKAREELERMVNVSNELKMQSQNQEKEILLVEEDQRKTRDEVDSLKTKLQFLLAEKEAVEQRLENLRQENSKLETFIQVSWLMLACAIRV
ncbi:hypothetical protein EDD86DRAFT_187572 [Gorgonomyces haynaldii]|nr:hypothetical protein EDD86DRAFT_187572 [Gorgonomyces haynaldii]